MRSEKGITLVCLIGFFVLIVILAGISISIAAKGSNDEVVPKNNTLIEETINEEIEAELIVDPTVTTKPISENQVENVTAEENIVEESQNIVEVENVVETEELDSNTVSNEIEE